MPAAVATFVGRAGQIDAVAAALSDSRLVTLHGPAGVGKSRLAQEVAHHVRDRYSEGVWWVDLTVAGDLPEVLARLVGTLGVSVPPNASATDVLAIATCPDPGWSQIDLPRQQKSGLVEALHVLRGVSGLSFVHLSGEDVVRHQLVRRVIEAYDRWEAEQAPPVKPLIRERAAP